MMMMMIKELIINCDTHQISQVLKNLNN